MKKNPKNRKLSTRITWCHHRGRAALGSFEFRYINANGKISAPRFDMFAEICTSSTGSARWSATAMIASTTSMNG